MSQSTTASTRRNATYVGLALIIGAALWVASYTHPQGELPEDRIVCGIPGEPQARIVIPHADPRF